MNLDIIMQILYANNLTDVIVLATKIENNITDPTELGEGDMIAVRVSKEDLSKLGLKPKEDKEREYWFSVDFPILSVNKYALEKKYLVDVLGKRQWVAVDDSKYSSSVEPIAMPVAPLEDQTFG